MFYLVEVNTEKNESGDTVTSQGIFAHADMDSALIAFHQSVGYAMSNEKVLQMGRCILNEAMMPMRTENWTRPVAPAPAPEPENTGE